MAKIELEISFIFYILEDFQLLIINFWYAILYVLSRSLKSWVRMIVITMRMLITVHIFKQLRDFSTFFLKTI